MPSDTLSCPRRWDGGYIGEGKDQFLSLHMGRRLILDLWVKQKDQNKEEGIYGTT